MSPKACLFHSLRHSFKFLSFCWKRYILEPYGMVTSLHHMGAIVWKSGWLSQNISNQKRLWTKEARMSNQSWMGQWSNLGTSRMLDSKTIEDAGIFLDVLPNQWMWFTLHNFLVFLNASVKKLL
jgi:hypothetical protein